MTALGRRNIGWAGNFPQERFYPWRFMGQRDEPAAAPVRSQDLEIVAGTIGLASIGLGVALGRNFGRILAAVGASAVAASILSSVLRRT